MHRLWCDSIRKRRPLKLASIQGVARDVGHRLLLRDDLGDAPWFTIAPPGYDVAIIEDDNKKLECVYRRMGAASQTVSHGKKESRATFGRVTKGLSILYRRKRSRPTPRPRPRAKLHHPRKLQRQTKDKRNKVTIIAEETRLLKHVKELESENTRLKELESQDTTLLAENEELRASGKDIKARAKDTLT